MAEAGGVDNKKDEMEESLDLTEAYRKMWEAKDLKWHSDSVEPALLKHYSKITQGKAGGVIFFPFCGKDPAMKYMLDKGHVVIGVELSPIGCRDFFLDNKIKFKENNLNEKVIQFTSEAGNIRLYGCNFMDYDPDMEAAVDLIWDRGAMQTLMEDSALSNYVEKIKKMFRPGVAGYTVADIFEGEENLTTDKIRTKFGAGFSVEEFDIVPALPVYAEEGVKNVQVSKITLI